MKEQKSRDVIKYLRSIGWVFLRDAPGSHEIWGLPDGSVKASIPAGHRTISPGVLNKISRRQGIQWPREWK